MAKKTNIRRNIILLSIFAFITVSLLISLAFSSTIEAKLGFARSIDGSIDVCTFRYDVIDVGQGAASLVTMANGEYILIDAGTNKSEKHLVDYLKKRNITKIDYFILTHSDNDHTGGADAIYENFDVVKTYRPFILAENTKYTEDPLLYYKNSMETMVVDSDDWAKCVELMYKETYGTENTASLVEIVSNNCLPIISGASSLRFFWPTATGSMISEKVGDLNETIGYVVEKCTSTNNYSPIMLISYYDIDIVVTGDADQTVENKVLTNLETADELDYFASVEIYVAGHHGSNSSSCADFLNVILPKTIVVQCGNSKYHPHTKFLERVKQIWQEHMISGVLYRTDKNSDVVFEFDGTDSENVKSRVFYDGVAASYNIKWWQIVVATIGVSAVILVVPILPRRRRFSR